jgi:SEC-C motif-containing protein
MDCPCGSGAGYAQCCGLLHAGASAEMLMRSRYSACALGLTRYLLASWCVSARPSALDLASDLHTRKWLGLSVRARQDTGPESAMVEFTARYRVGGGSATRMEEGRWYYLDTE